MVCSPFPCCVQTSRWLSLRHAVPRPHVLQLSSRGELLHPALSHVQSPAFAPTDVVSMRPRTHAHTHTQVRKLILTSFLSALYQGSTEHLAGALMTIFLFLLAHLLLKVLAPPFPSSHAHAHAQCRREELTLRLPSVSPAMTSTSSFGQNLAPCKPYSKSAFMTLFLFVTSISLTPDHLAALPQPGTQHLSGEHMILC